jgi:hypothetical protein
MRQAVQSPTSRWIVFLLVYLILFPAGNAGFAQRATQNSSNTSEPMEVSMVALLASPQKYNGKSIRTRGFMCLEFEGNALYLHEEDYRYGLRKNAVQLILTKAQEEQFKSLSLKHVLVEGTLSAENWGVERGMYNGSIGNITRLEYWRPRGDIPVPPEEPLSSCSR